MFGIHPDLRSHVMVAFVASAAVGVLGLATLVGFAADATRFRGMPAWLAIGFGVAALGVGYIGTVVAPRWHRESSLIVRSEQPIEVTVRLSRTTDSDSTHLRAQFEAQRESSLPAQAIEIIPPRWDITPLLARPIRVFAYMHPLTSRIVALETTLGRLWSVPSGIRHA
jgi:hypothetical protein